MNPTVEDLRKAILEILTNRGGQALGSQIGSKLLSIYPDLNIKGQFKGLHNLIVHCAPQEVFCIGKSGLDNYYSTSLEDDCKNPKTVKPATPWSVFHNPSLPGEVGVNTETGKLVFLHDAINSSVIKIPRVSHEEQRKIISDFIMTTVSPSEKCLFNAALEANNDEYWAIFKKSLLELKIVSKWVEYRASNLHHLLDKKAKEAGVFTQIVSEQVHHLSSSKDLASSKKDAPNEKIAKLRDFIISVILKMDETQLNELKLPIGSVWSTLTDIQKSSLD